MTVAATSLEQSATGTAGSKLILFGEHAVVHGADALAIGMSVGIKVMATRSKTVSSLLVNNWNLFAQANGETKTDLALRTLLQTLNAPMTGIALTATADIPYGAGLGSSASLAVASAKAIDKLLSLNISNEKLLDAVMTSESIFHTNPSGVDAYTVMKPGCIRFNKKTGVSIIDTTIPKMYIINSGLQGSTSKMVAVFSTKLHTDHGAKNKILRMGQIVEEGELALVNGNIKKMGDLMNENHEILRWFGVSCSALDNICEIALQHGAAGAKMTGGGGGGCVNILPDSKTNETALLQALLQAGYSRII